MKNSMLVKAIMICLFVFTFAFAGNTVNNTCTLSSDTYLEMADVSYSWNADANAVSYIVELEHTGNGEQYSAETTATSITFFGMPSGSYEITVRAKYADGSTGIIIEDFIVG